MRPVLEATLISKADRLSRETTLFTPDTLWASAQNETENLTRATFDKAMTGLLGAGFLRSDDQALLRTDRSDRWQDIVGRAMSNPEATNPRASDREGLSDRELLQPQRYNIVDVARYGGAENALKEVLSSKERASALYIHGDGGPDIARFPLNTPNMTAATGFVGQASKALHSGKPSSYGFNRETLLVISDTAFRSAHRAALLITATEQLRIGKVIVLADTSQSPPNDLFVLAEAARQGAASHIPASNAFKKPGLSEDVSPALKSVLANAQAVQTGTLEQAAALEHVSRPGRSQLFSHDPIRDLNLNRAVQAISRPASDKVFEAKILQALPSALVNYKTGAGLREGDILRVDHAPESSGYRAGDIYRLTNVKAIGGAALAKNSAGRYVNISLKDATEGGVRLNAYHSESMKVREGDKIMAPNGAMMERGAASMVNESSFVFQPETGEARTISKDMNETSQIRLGYTANPRELRADHAIIMTAGSSDKAGSGHFSPGAALLAAQVSRSYATEMKLFTDNPGRFLENARATDTTELAQMSKAFDLFKSAQERPMDMFKGHEERSR